MPPKKSTSSKEKKTDESRVNKSELIRQVLKSIGETSAPKEVIAKLASRNIVVSPAQVSNVKAALAKKAGLPPIGKSRGGREEKVSLSGLIEAKRLADRMGGVEAAKRALDTLSRLR